jgi:hypothetical protein
MVEDVVCFCAGLETRNEMVEGKISISPREAGGGTECMLLERGFVAVTHAQHHSIHVFEQTTG